MYLFGGRGIGGGEEAGGELVVLEETRGVGELAQGTPHRRLMELGAPVRLVLIHK